MPPRAPAFPRTPFDSWSTEFTGSDLLLGLVLPEASSSRAVSPLRGDAGSYLGASGFCWARTCHAGARAWREQRGRKKEAVAVESDLARGMAVLATVSCFDSRRKMRRKMVRTMKKMKLMMVSRILTKQVLAKQSPQPRTFAWFVELPRLQRRALVARSFSRIEGAACPLRAPLKLSLVPQLMLSSGDNQGVAQPWWGDRFQYLLAPTELGKSAKIKEANCLETRF